jgi:prepilin-type N-terminal cleavage/methylation domain-containing protein
MERGFTLVEIAIVVLVLGLLLASFLGPLSVRIEQLEIRKTSDQMDEIKEALYGYAMANGALPCPDRLVGAGAGDGIADAPCPAGPEEGFLPFVTLGVAAGDAWGLRFRYRVTPEFTIPDDDHLCLPDQNPLTPAYNYAPDQKLDLCDPGDIIIETRRYDDRNPPDEASDVPAVILSHGKNGYGATRTDGSNVPPPDLWSATNADEETNTDGGNRRFVNRHYSAETINCDDNDASQPYCAFDDIVVWLSANVLKYRLVQAGRLP